MEITFSQAMANIKRHEPRYSRRKKTMRTRYTKENDGNTRRQQIRTHTARALASFCVMCISLGALVRLTRTDPSSATYDDPSHHYQSEGAVEYEKKRAELMTRRYHINTENSHFYHGER